MYNIQTYIHMYIQYTITIIIHSISLLVVLILMKYYYINVAAPYFLYQMSYEVLLAVEKTHVSHHYTNQIHTTINNDYGKVDSTE